MILCRKDNQTLTFGNFYQTQKTKFNKSGYVFYLMTHYKLYKNILLLLQLHINMLICFWSCEYTVYMPWQKLLLLFRVENYLLQRGGGYVHDIYVCTTHLLYVCTTHPSHSVAATCASTSGSTATASGRRLLRRVWHRLHRHVLGGLSHPRTE